MQHFRAVFFDFDGTIADTRSHIGEAINAQMRARGAPQLDIEDERLRDLSTRQLLKEMKVSMLQLPAIVGAVRQELARVMPKVDAFLGLREALFALADRGVVLGIVTSNSRANVVAFLERHDFPPCAGVLTSSRLFGKSRMIARMVTDLGLALESVVYVGDETRDIEAARKAGVAAAAVTWGFNSRALLSRSAPDFILDHPRELERFGPDLLAKSRFPA